jgi:hypothetical protein
MYVWKCWRDSRSRFIFFVIVISAVCVLFTIYAATPGGRTGFFRVGPASDVAYLWSWVATTLLQALTTIIALFAGLVLAPSSVGQEYQQQTLGFLFTRPRSRKYLNWTCWSVGACEILGLIATSVLGTFATLVCVSRYIYSWLLLAAILPLFVGAVAVYSMTYFLTVYARSSEKGLSYGVGILVISCFLPLAQPQLNHVLSHVWYGHVLHLASFLSLMWTGCGWIIAPAGAFPIGALIFYALLALAFPMLAQLVLERREV